MPLLLLTPREDIPDTFILADAATRLGWDVQRADSYFPEKALREQEVVLYGETLFTTLAARSLDLIVLEPTFDWLAQAPPGCCRRQVQHMTLAAARQITKPAFIKPADGNKGLDAQIYHNGSELPTHYIDGNLPILVSDPVTWAVEYRSFILERQIVTYSIYARYGELAKTPDGKWQAPDIEVVEARQFCQTILDDESIRLPPTLVLDIGKIENSGWAIVEPNPVSSSGIYGCDPEQVLSTLRRACIKREQLTDAEQQWAVERPI